MLQTDANVKVNSFLYNHVMKNMLKHLQKKMGAEDIHKLLEVDTVRSVLLFRSYPVIALNIAFCRTLRGKSVPWNSVHHH